MVVALQDLLIHLITGESVQYPIKNLLESSAIMTKVWHDSGSYQRDIKESFISAEKQKLELRK